MPDLSILKTVYLISCVSKKRSTPAQARDLYTSDWFLKARDYVESTHSPWFILSAEHGLVPPNGIWLRMSEHSIRCAGRSARHGRHGLRLKWKHLCLLRIASLCSLEYVIGSS